MPAGDEPLTPRLCAAANDCIEQAMNVVRVVPSGREDATTGDPDIEVWKRAPNVQEPSFGGSRIDLEERGYPR